MLGFVGNETVHRDNAIALIEDMITAHRRNHRKAEIVFVMAIDSESMTGTQADLIDHCLTSGYQLGLVTTPELFDRPEINGLSKDAQGNMFVIGDGTPLGEALAVVLANWEADGDSDIRMILVADANDSDDAYFAVEAAAAKGITIRSLLHGLDMVRLESDEEEPPTFDDPEDVDVPDEDDASVEDDDDDDDVVNTTKFPHVALEEFDGYPGAEDSADDEQEDAPVAVDPAPESGAITADYLTDLMDRDLPAFYELAAANGVHSGRGIKRPTMLKRLKEALGIDGPVAPVKPTEPEVNDQPPLRAAQVAVWEKSDDVDETPEVVVPEATVPEPISSRHIDTADIQALIDLASAALKVARKLL